jgi:phosphatidylinositol-3-phosphatase
MFPGNTCPMGLRTRLHPGGRVRRGALLACVVAASILVAGCTTSGGAPGAARGTAAGTPSAADGALPHPDHVVIVVFENKDEAAVRGAKAAPYLNSLAGSSATLTNAHGVAHPSQPNYLALFSGSTQGVTDDSCPQKLTGENLGDQLRAAGKSFVGYAEDLPQAGYTGCGAARYARKHAPWVDFTNLPASVSQPLSAMPSDWSNLPTVSFVTPNMCNDMHDCSVATGDRWAEQHLPGYVSWAKDHNSLLIVTFDEDGGSRDNHIATIVAGAGVQQTSSDQRVDHYGLLRTLEDMYALPPLGAAANASPITGIWAPKGA